MLGMCIQSDWRMMYHFAEDSIHFHTALSKDVDVSDLITIMKFSICLCLCLNNKIQTYSNKILVI